MQEAVWTGNGGFKIVQLELFDNVALHITPPPSCLIMLKKYLSSGSGERGKSKNSKSAQFSVQVQIQTLPLIIQTLACFVSKEMKAGYSISGFMFFTAENRPYRSSV